MQIHVASGVGTGPTTMAAFDNALGEIGIANYNMLRLSSVVPPNTKVMTYESKLPFALPGTWGDRLYIVMAEKRTDKHNVDAWAGVGWFQDKKTGQGMFTEHEGESEDFVKREIVETLEGLKKNRQKEGDFDWGPIQMKVVGKTCTDQPVCAMAVAVYQVSDWENKPHLVEPKQGLSRLGRFWKS